MKDLLTKAQKKEYSSNGFLIVKNVLSQEKIHEWSKQIPLKRGGNPIDVANTTLFLASDLSTYVTGQVINVCGGMLT